MKIGEIKAEALMLMGISNNLNITWGDIESYKNDPTYAMYLHAMIGAINRCLKRLYVAGAIANEPLNIQSDSEESAEMTEFVVDITETLSNMIPLYVVGDIFAMEEPAVAQDRRNEFEALLEQYLNKRAFPDQDKVEIIYGV